MCTLIIIIIMNRHLKFHTFTRIRFNNIKTGLYILVAALLMVTCGSRASLTGPAPLLQLRADIREVFEDPNFFMANWGIYIESLKTGEIIYKQNPYKLFMPASNMKLFTTATALVRLGHEYRYSTHLLSRGETDSLGILHGDLLIKGSGDPSLSGRFNEGNARGIFEEWADSLRARNIHLIDGDIIGDDDCFDDENYGGGWEYDDLSSWYAAPVSGLSYNENVVRLIITPDSSAGSSPHIAVDPPTSYVTVVNNAVTIAPTRIQSLKFHRKIGTNTIVVEGTISTDHKPHEQFISIENPTLYAVTVLKETLEEKGIICHGNPRDIDDMNITERTEFYKDWKVAASYLSPPLSELVTVVNKESNNFYADQLLKTLGKEYIGAGSFSNGIAVEKEFLGGIGINPEQFKAYDGSGLSRHDLVTPMQIATLLKYMRYHPEFNLFYSSLPVAGVDGTIRNRMRNTAAEHIVHAKTGTIRYVRALSGYVTSRDNEEFVVAILVNHYTTPSSTSAALQDRLFVLLANFSRER